MTRSIYFVALVTVGTLAGPALAGEIAGAGSGSTGGVISGTTNESSGNMKTGVDTGIQPMNGAGPQTGVVRPNDAVLNAGEERVPGQNGASVPSTLNGQ